MTFHLAGGCRGRPANPGRAQERYGRVKLGGDRCKYLVFSAWPHPEVPGAVEEGVTPWPPGQAGKVVPALGESRLGVQGWDILMGER